MLVCGTMKSLFDFGDLDLIFKVHQHSELSNFDKIRVSACYLFNRTRHSS